ncbi:MAG: Fic family protein [Candidatus Aenigmarchaeota archaeon]|nr:Fic family protein [Candidatus Aenigmarchaeota archaeon]
MPRYNSFSEVVPATQENILRFCKESNRIENITHDDPTSLYIVHHLAAFDYIKNNKRISIRELHRILMEVDSERFLIDYGERIGEYRKHRVRIGSHIPPPPQIVELLMKNLQDDIEASLKGEYKPDTEWYFHNRFEIIHPFVDGNGRTGRLLLNFVRMHYFPDDLVIVRSKDKLGYYHMLDEYRKQKK